VLVLGEETEQLADLLERDRAAERDLPRAIDRPDPARADRGQLLVARVGAAVGALDLAADRGVGAPA